MSSGEAVDKVTIVNTLKQMRDAPTEDIYDDLKEELLEITDGLLVKPGNTKHFVTFHQYFDKYWHGCRQMWVFCHRKTFPTMGVNDTQAAESTFRALKHYEKLEFGRTTPRLEVMIPIIIKVLANRHKKRLQRITNKRLVIHHDNSEFKYALDQASYVLNNGGMSLFHDTLKLLELRSPLMEIVDGEVHEKYNGRWAKGYVGKYSCDGDSCGCSTYKSSYFCRHLLFFRQSMNLPLFQQSMFHRIHLLEGTNPGSELHSYEDEEQNYDFERESLILSP